MRPADFNQYGTRRGNHEVMMRGTFANIRIKNFMLKGADGNIPEGGLTKHWPDGEQMSIYDAAMKYQAEKVPLVVFAGAEYGNGSSRDWAAKGTRLLGVRAVICQSFERIHRSNLVGMGVLPLTFEDGASWQSIGLKGDETVTIRGLAGRSETAPEADGGDRLGRWLAAARLAAVPDRYARRARILSKRRHPALRAAQAGGVMRIVIGASLRSEWRAKGRRPMKGRLLCIRRPARSG